MIKTTVKKEAIIKARQKLGAKLLTRRVDLGYSQTELAAMVGIERSQLSRIERGTIAYSIDYLLVFDELLTKLNALKDGNK